MGKATIIKREIEIHEPAGVVWKTIADIGNICQAHPAVKNSYVTSEQTEGVGATRHCEFTMMGASADEKVIEWNEGKNVKIEVVKLNKMPGIDTMELDLKIKSQGDFSKLSATMKYTMKNGFFDLLNQVMMKKMNTKLLEGILAGHQAFIETCEPVNDQTKLDTSNIIKLA